MSETTPKDLTQRQNDRGNLLEYSVVYTDRAINLMADPFKTVMTTLSSTLKKAYNAEHVAIIPGSGTFAMESVARAFSTKGQFNEFMVIRNGFFSFRWSEIFSVGGIDADHTVLKATCKSEKVAPMEISLVVKEIQEKKPKAVFIPQVETSTGVIVSEDYLKQVAAAVHEVGGYLILDSIAAGTVWVDLEALSVDVLISAPQKGWSSPACAGLVVMREAAYQFVTENINSMDSFSLSLKQWLGVMKQYESGGFKYYTTLPTDALTEFAKNADELLSFGLSKAKEAAEELGTKVRAMLEKLGFESVAADEVQAPTVVVVYRNNELKERSVNVVGELKKHGVQVAGGVPFKIDEPEGIHLNAFRIGLFGLDKLKNVDRTVTLLEAAIKKL